MSVMFTGNGQSSSRTTWSQPTDPWEVCFTSRKDDPPLTPDLPSRSSSSVKELMSIDLFRSIDRSFKHSHKDAHEPDIFLLDQLSNEEFKPRYGGQNEESIMLPQAPRSSNHRGIDAIHPQKLSMKKQRKHKTTVAAVGGLVVGGLTLGPLGIFVGAAAGAVATNKVCKARERRAQRRYEQNSFQHGAAQSNIHLASFV